MAKNPKWFRNLPYASFSRGTSKAKDRIVRWVLRFNNHD